MNKKRIIYFILTLTIAIAIFMFSSQKSEDSNRLSYKIDIIIFNFISNKAEATSANVASEENKGSNKSENSVDEKNVKSSNSNMTQSKEQYEYPVKNKTFRDIDFVVRKTAHVTLYTLFAISLALFIKTYNLKNWKVVIIVIIIGFLYACLDEYNQKLGGTRSGLFTDTLIDTTGCLIGVTAVIKKMKKKMLI